jgi:hypothetical protein
MSISSYAEDRILDAIFNNTALQLGVRYVQLHTGDPGEDGTANVATETTRKGLSNAAASGGTFVSPNNLSWTNVAASETYSHLSIHDDPTAGNCVWTGEMVDELGDPAPVPILVGQTFTIEAGDLAVGLD